MDLMYFHVIPMTLIYGDFMYFVVFFDVNLMILIYFDHGKGLKRGINDWHITSDLRAACFALSLFNHTCQVMFNMMAW